MGAQAGSTQPSGRRLCRKEVASYVGSLSLVVADFKERVRHEAAQDSMYQKLVEQVKGGTMRRY